MENIGHFFHAWVVFVAPLMYLGYKPKFKKQALFTLLYGLGVIFSREIYEFLPLPFGTHMILLIILNAVLVAIIMKEINWVEAISISLTTFIILLINDSIIFLPFMEYLDITITDFGSTNLITYITLWLVSNLLLIIICMVGILKHRTKHTYNL